MSELNETVNTGETPATTPTSTSWLNLAIESVMDLIDQMGNFANITRGALGIDNGLSCEVSPSNVQEVYLDKNVYAVITLALNGKHSDLQILSDTLNNIMDTLTRMTSYPSGSGFDIVDISNGIFPRVIGREQNNQWLMACDLVIKIYRKD